MRFILLALVCALRLPSLASAEPPPEFLTMWGIPSGDISSGMPWGVAVDAAGYQKFGFGPTPVASVTWGALKSRYRGEHGLQP